MCGKGIKVVFLWMRGTRSGIKLQRGNFQINMKSWLLIPEKEWFSGETEFHVVGDTETEAISPV